jgi:Flagellar hook-length control protein FliK
MQNVGPALPLVSKAASGGQVTPPHLGAAFSYIVGPATSAIVTTEPTVSLAATTTEAPLPTNAIVDPAASDGALGEVITLEPILRPDGLPPFWPQVAPAFDLPHEKDQRPFVEIDILQARSSAPAMPSSTPLTDVMPVTPDTSEVIRWSPFPTIAPAGAVTDPTPAPDGPQTQDARPHSVPQRGTPMMARIGATPPPHNAIPPDKDTIAVPVPLMPDAQPHVVATQPPPAQAASVTPSPSMPAAAPNQPQTPALHHAEAEPRVAAGPGMTDPEPVPPAADMTIRAYTRTQALAAQLTIPSELGLPLKASPALRVLVQDVLLHGSGQTPVAAKGNPPPETEPATPTPATNAAGDTPVALAVEAAPDAGVVFGNGTFQPGLVATGTITVPGAAIPMAALPQVVAKALNDNPTQQVELRLDPPELGSVRFQLDQSRADLVVTIIAERPDTLDLMRRHADQLLADLRQAGFQGASLNFGTSQGQGGSGQGGSGQSGHGSAPPSGQNAPPAPPSFATPAPPPPRATKGGLNLRL